MTSECPTQTTLQRCSVSETWRQCFEILVSLAKRALRPPKAAHLSELNWGPTFIMKSFHPTLALLTLSSLTFSPSNKHLIIRLSCLVHHGFKGVFRSPHMYLSGQGRGLQVFFFFWVLPKERRVDWTRGGTAMSLPMGWLDLPANGWSSRHSSPSVTHSDRLPGVGMRFYPDLRKTVLQSLHELLIGF